jgi:hypothetical protein
VQGLVLALRMSDQCRAARREARMQVSDKFLREEDEIRPPRGG